MIRTKICGHTRDKDVAASVWAGADAVGVITDVPVDSSRAVYVSRAVELLDSVPPLVTGVLVTMPDTPENAIDLVERARPDVLQIHGSFSSTDLETVRESVSRPIIKSVDSTSPEEAHAFDAVADALLIDSIDTDGAGGTGHTHDWERTRELTADLDSPVILAGGLTPENVVEAVETVEPFGVDVASGVEEQEGIKDHDAIERFVRRARKARAEVPVR